jgi:polynucleotide 5'-hydroxyl-kinase GRC3/NOL9
VVKRTVETGKTILVDGPASVEILSGKVNILGATAKKGERLIIREGKRAPFEVDKRASFDLTLGNGASSEEIEGSTIPPSWKAALTDIFSLGKPVTVMVIGDIDSGKTSFCTFLVNEAVRTKRRTAIIDADLGQSDIGPPSTIGFSLIKSSVKDLFEIEAERAYFVGVTSPTGAAKRVLDGLTTLRTQASNMNIDFLIINTDGWIEGEAATEYKASLVDHVRPDVVIGTQHGEELAPILNALDKTKTLTVSSSPAVHKRSREKRKVLRELGYAKYLKNAKVESFPLDWI